MLKEKLMLYNKRLLEEAPLNTTPEESPEDIFIKENMNSVTTFN